MDIEEAFQILELEEKKGYSVEDIKKQYRLLALLYHPDKNKSDSATIHFQEIKEAYEYLVENYIIENEYEINMDSQNYENIVFSFLKSVLNNDTKNIVINKILEIICSSCEETAVEFLNKIDKKVLIKIYNILNKYSDVLHINNVFLEKINKITKEKYEKDECIILNPTIDDLLEDNLYRIKVNGFIYIVPLWHNELVYDNSGNDIYVKCLPILPDNIEIITNNNILVNIILTIDEILKDDILKIKIGKRVLDVSRELLHFKKNQKIWLFEKGISLINTKDIYDISNKSDIIVNIEILEL
jgi:hypothetical protein